MVSEMVSEKSGRRGQKIVPSFDETIQSKDAGLDRSVSSSCRMVWTKTSYVVFETKKSLDKVELYRLRCQKERDKIAVCRIGVPEGAEGDRDVPSSM